MSRRNHTRNICCYVPDTNLPTSSTPQPETPVDFAQTRAEGQGGDLYTERYALARRFSEAITPGTSYLEESDSSSEVLVFVQSDRWSGDAGTASISAALTGSSGGGCRNLRPRPPLGNHRHLAMEGALSSVGFSRELRMRLPNFEPEME